MNRFLTLATSAALLAAGLVWVSPSKAVAVPAAVHLPCLPGVPLPGDYDGDGRADRLIGAIDGPATKVYEVIPADGGTPYRIEGRLDTTVVNADLNGDRCADVVVDATTLLFGTPGGLDVANPGTVPLPQLPSDSYYRRELRAAALRHDGISQVVVAGWFADTEDSCCEKGHFLDVFTLDAAGVAGAPQVIDVAGRGFFSDSMVVAGSGRSIALGLPGLTVKGKGDAGGVLMFSSSAGDPATLTFRTLLTQDSARIPDAVEEDDRFGGSLSFRDGRLAIGAYAEQFGKVRDAGLVQPVWWHEATSTYTAYRAIHQGTRGVVGTNEDGDYFGSEVVVTRGLTAKGSYDIAIGSSETVGKVYDAGSVTVASFSKAAYRTYTQNSKGVPGTAGKNNMFGRALGVVRTSPATDTLLIGAFGGGTRAPSDDYVIRSDGRKLSGSTKWTSLRPANAPDTTDASWGFTFAA